MTSLLLTRVAALVLALTYVSGCAISPGSAKWRDKSNVLLAAQEKDGEQPNAIGGKKRVIYAAFALHSDSTAFQGDATLVRDVLRSINSQMSVLLLSNQFEHSDIVYPFATKENIRSVLSKVARLADKDTLVILLFTSHGSPDQLTLKIGYGDYSNNLGTEELRTYLEALKAIPTIIIISACYSGSFVPALANDNRIIITAASKDRVSFGCSPKTKGTYFIEEFFQHNFNASMSLSQLFSQASRQVAERERREHFTGSQPQMYVGERMKSLALVPLRDLLTKMEEFPADDKTPPRRETQLTLETDPKVDRPELKVEDKKRKIGQANEAAIPAKVVRTVPEDGRENVPTSLKEILIVFDQPMSTAWSISCSPGFYPDAPRGRTCSEGGTYWRDDRSFVVQLTKGLKPNQRYSFGTNQSVGLENYDLTRAFRGLGHSKPVLPQRFFFTTGP